MPISINFYFHEIASPISTRRVKTSTNCSPTLDAVGTSNECGSGQSRLSRTEIYAPSEVAAILNVSYDAALRLMQKMKGVVDLGTPTRRYKRGKKKLRISGKNLLAFLSAKTRE